MRVSRCAALLLLAGCFGDRSGTAVGNPTMDAQLARVAHGTPLTAVWPVDRVAFTACDDGEVITAQPGTLDLLGRDAIAMPERDVCAIEIVSGGKIEIAGQTEEGNTLRASFELGGLVFEPAAARPGAYVLELGTPDFLDASGPGAVVIEGNTPEAEAALAAITSGSGLFVDHDQDGAVSDEERAAGAVATSAPLADDADDTDTSTDTDDSGDSDTN